MLIDRFTGQLKLERADLLMDIGETINPGIDKGKLLEVSFRELVGSQMKICVTLIKVSSCPIRRQLTKFRISRIFRKYSM